MNFAVHLIKKKEKKLKWKPSSVLFLNEGLKLSSFTKYSMLPFHYCPCVHQDYDD